MLWVSALGSGVSGCQHWAVLGVSALDSVVGVDIGQCCRCQHWTVLCVSALDCVVDVDIDPCWGCQY